MDKNKMSWDKCKDCEFLVDFTGSVFMGYRCHITGESLVLTGCIKDSYEDGVYPLKVEK